MAWSNSKIFHQYIDDLLDNTTDIDIVADTMKVALYDNSITPSNTVTAALSAYDAGTSQWLTANEVYEAGQWAQGGVALSSKTTTPSAGVVTYDAADTASGSAADLASVYGCLVYSDTVTTPVADQGVCYNYFGGSNTVVNGTFTVVWHANGIFSISVA